MVTKNRIIRVAVFAGIIAFAVLIQKIFFQSAPVIYRNFGIPIPAGYSTHGIDVSRYQRKIDWEMVAQMRDRGQKISFAIIKATEGVRLKDPHFDRNWREIEKVPLIRGAYLYFKPSKDGQEQADFFIRHVSLKKGDLPPVVDIEETNRTTSPKIRKRLRDCLLALQAHYGVKPMIYTNVHFYRQHLGEEFHVYPLWAAHYEKAKMPRIEREWTIWQHSCKGHVSGIKTEVDFNVVNGSISALQELCL